MKSSLAGTVPPYISADLTDRYSIRCRAIDLCGLRPAANRSLKASFWHWYWDPAPKPLDVGVVAQELPSARCSTIDGPQGLARPGQPMRSCDRRTAAAAKVPDARPSRAQPFGGFMCSSLDLFDALAHAGLEISPTSPGRGVSEVYPGFIWKELANTGLPKKATKVGRSARRDILRALGVVGIPASVTHDQLDAAVGALTAAAAAGAVEGLTAKAVGDPLYRDEKGTLREGPMLLPLVRSRKLNLGLPRAAAMRGSSAPVLLAGPAVPEKLAETAQALLRWLVAQATESTPHVCTYAWAFTHLLGRQPAHWSRAYTRQILGVAAGTAPLALEGLGSVRLDAFIVCKSNGEPGGGHWTRAPYSVERWRNVLAGANTLSCEGSTTDRRQGN